MRVIDTGTDQISKRVAAEVRAEIARQGITQTSVAVRLGWTQAYMSRRLGGEVALSVGELSMIASALDVQPAQFFPALERVA